jgi:alanine racemase
VAERRWAWAEVDLAAIEHNVRALKGLTAPGTRFMAVVKSDGYGHGSIQVGGAALAAGADRLGVATVDEAGKLRQAGVTAPIHVLSEPPAAAAGFVVRHGLTCGLYSRDFALALSKAASVAQTTAVFHLKLNTGMNRVGVEAAEGADFLESLRGLPGISLEGVYTHFATADIPGDWEFERQLERFSSAIAEMRLRKIDPGIVHAANSPATVLHPETHFDMVRCGVALYGLHPSEATRERVDLRPAMSVKARVTQVRRIGMGEGVSYGFTYHAGAPTTIATLPLGYADGMRRGLSNRATVLIRGRECRQVGRICMDQLMVEVPRGADVGVGDEAVIVGRQGDAEISMDTQADVLGTINYEIACGYGARLQHHYLGRP